MTDFEREFARLLAAAMVARALAIASEKKLPISPTMRPDPQAVAASHGALISHESA